MEDLLDYFRWPQYLEPDWKVRRVFGHELQLS